jgi:ABC-2 type transport system permease protein
MVNVIFEIARKEITSYYGRKSIIVQNLILFFVFCILPIQQAGSLLAANGYRASALASLDILLMVASFFPIMVECGISVMAFPVERDQKTIEHLMSLPLTDGEIFLGKVLAAIATGLAGMAMVYSAVIGYLLAIEGRRIVWDAPLLTPSLVIFIFAVAPLLVALSTMMLVALSGYIANTRESYLVNVVLMGAMIGVNSVRLEVQVDPLLFNLGLFVLLAALVMITFAVGMKVFSREKLISRV